MAIPSVRFLTLALQGGMRLVELLRFLPLMELNFWKYGPRLDCGGYYVRSMRSRRDT